MQFTVTLVHIERLGTNVTHIAFAAALQLLGTPSYQKAQDKIPPMRVWILS